MHIIQHSRRNEKGNNPGGIGVDVGVWVIIAILGFNILVFGTMALIDWIEKRRSK